MVAREETEDLTGFCAGAISGTITGAAITGAITCASITGAMTGAIRGAGGAAITGAMICAGAGFRAMLLSIIAA